MKKKKSHNMLCLMLDLRFKNLCLISSFIDYEKKGEHCWKYDKQSLYLMFLKCYHCLHPMEEFKVGCVNQIGMQNLIWIFFNKLPT
jgi:hypothetical protein